MFIGSVDKMRLKLICRQIKEIRIRYYQRPEKHPVIMRVRKTLHVTIAVTMNPRSMSYDTAPDSTRRGRLATLTRIGCVTVSDRINSLDDSSS